VRARASVLSLFGCFELQRRKAREGSSSPFSTTKSPFPLHSRSLSATKFPLLPFSFVPRGRLGSDERKSAFGKALIIWNE